MLGLLAGVALAIEPVLVTAERVVDDAWPGEHDPAALRRAALEGMVAYLNERESLPVNRLLAPDEATVPWGLGLEYLLVPGRGLVVTDVVEPSAASRAGLVPGDVVTRLGGQDTTAALDPDELTGVAAGAVPLLVQRAGGHATSFVLQPGPLPAHTLRARPDHLQVTVRAPTEELTTVVAAAVAAAPDQPVLIDLRGATGGTVVGAVGLADVLLPVDAIIGFELRQGTQHELASTRPPLAPAVAVLIDAGTAGPAELIAASLQHHGRATVIGTPSAGLAGATSVRFLDAEHALQLVDARLRDPAGESWDGGGVKPDVRIQPRLETPPDGAVPRDAQVDAALTALGLRGAR